jgi:hypothetical protein
MPGSKGVVPSSLQGISFTFPCNTCLVSEPGVMAIDKMKTNR